MGLHTTGKKWKFVVSLCTFIIVLSMGGSEADELSGFNITVKQWAVECRADVEAEMNLLLSSGRLNIGQLFDTFYIPIPKTTPQKYSTQYDKLFDMVLQRILDSYQKKNDRILFVIAVDRNGYLPTHNSKYSQPLTGNSDIDTKRNRTKRLFNDRTGLAAARNKKEYLLQEYSRDTGEKVYDLSIPIFIHKQHWGAIRIGYK